MEAGRLFSMEITESRSASKCVYLEPKNAYLEAKSVYLGLKNEYLNAKKAGGYESGFGESGDMGRVAKAVLRLM